MSTTIKSLLAISLVALVTACSAKEETVYIQEPIVEEPTMSKY
ncbi:hypothetical protein ACFE33_11315 [Falsihalocynthiibacter sp. SS001]